MTQEARLKDLNLRIASLEMGRQAALSQYVAAGMVGSETELAALRDQLHSILDLQIDAHSDLIRETRV